MCCSFPALPEFVLVHSTSLLGATSYLGKPMRGKRYVSVSLVSYMQKRVIKLSCYPSPSVPATFRQSPKGRHTLTPNDKSTWEKPVLLLPVAGHSEEHKLQKTASYFPLFQSDCDKYSTDQGGYSGSGQAVNRNTSLH